jgi:hypothetical protein
MFEPFSRGYYLGRLYVEPTGGERATIHARTHERVGEEVYGGESDVLVMKLDGYHLAVEGAEGVPEGTLAVPEPVLDDTGVSNPPALREVLLAKADRAAQLLEMTGA